MLTHPVGYASYAVPVRQYRYLQSGLLQCMDRSKPPCHLLMFRVTNPAHKRLSLFGLLILRTIFTIQGTHMSVCNMSADETRLKSSFSIKLYIFNQGDINNELWLPDGGFSTLPPSAIL